MGGGGVRGDLEGGGRALGVKPGPMGGGGGVEGVVKFCTGSPCHRAGSGGDVTTTRRIPAQGSRERGNSAAPLRPFR